MCLLPHASEEFLKGRKVHPFCHITKVHIIKVKYSFCCIIDTLTTKEDAEKPVKTEALVHVPVQGFRVCFWQNDVPQQQLHPELPGPPDIGRFTRFQLFIYLYYDNVYTVHVCIFIYANIINPSNLLSDTDLKPRSFINVQDCWKERLEMWLDMWLEK